MIYSARYLFYLIAISGILAFTAGAEAGGLQPGIWEVEEVIHVPLEGDRIERWDFRFLVDSSGSIVGVGEQNGARTAADGSTNSFAMVIMEPSEGGGCEGFYIRVYEDGEIFQMSLTGDLGTDGKTLILSALDGDGIIASTSHARWVRSEKNSAIRDGKWAVREIVSPERGGWNINWDFEFSRNSQTLVGEGRKARVNGRPAYPGERNTTSRVTLDFAEDDSSVIFGSARETNHRGGIIDAAYEGWISPSSEWFLVESYENGTLTGLLFGKAAF